MFAEVNNAPRLPPSRGSHILPDIRHKRTRLNRKQTVRRSGALEKSENKVIQHLYSFHFESSTLSFLNRHQHENTKISTRNANFCSFILNTFVFIILKIIILFLFEGSFTHAMKTSS